MTATVIGNGVFYNADCFDVMPTLGASAVDMVLCDLPYGTTRNKWDSVLDLKSLWWDYARVTGDNTAIVMMAAQPFSSVLVTSQLRQFKYEWIWHKSHATGHLNANRQPMREHESVLVFCAGRSIYNPQFREKDPRNVRPSQRGATSSNWGGFDTDAARKQPITTAYPRSVQKFDRNPPSNALHPTQKPVALFEYLIRTYTNEGALILDNCAGSGTTAIAAENAGRRWVCIEKDPDYAAKAIERIRAHVEAKRAAA